MSSCLEWRPYQPQQYKGILADELKFILRKKYGEPVNIILTYEDIPYLSGLADANIVGAKDAIDLINEWNEIEIKETY